MSRALLLLVICILALSGLHPGDALNCYRCTGPGCVSPEKIQSVACMSTEDTCLVCADFLSFLSFPLRFLSQWNFESFIATLRSYRLRLSLTLTRRVCRVRYTANPAAFIHRLWICIGNGLVAATGLLNHLTVINRNMTVMSIAS